MTPIRSWPVCIHVLTVILKERADVPSLDRR